MLVDADAKDVSKNYKKLITELRAIEREAVLEGEIVKKGRTTIFSITDIISIDAHDLSNIDLAKRKDLLKALIEKIDSPSIIYNG